MSTAPTADRAAAMSPKVKARLAAVFALATLLGGVIAQGLISDRLVIPTDAAATAANILANKSLYQVGFAMYLVELICQLTMTALLYDLLKPVSKSVASLAAIIGVVGCTIKTVARLFYFAPLLILGGTHDLSVFSSEQLQSLALLFFKVNDHGAAIALVFFGVYALLKGYLTIRSTFLPRILGVLSVMGGVGWLAFLWQPLGYRLFPYIAGVALIGSAANIGWMLIFGVNEQRWKEQAHLAAGSIWR